MYLKDVLELFPPTQEVQIHVPFTAIYIPRNRWYLLKQDENFTKLLNYKIKFITSKLNLMNNSYIMIYLEEN